MHSVLLSCVENCMVYEIYILWYDMATMDMEKYAITLNELSDEDWKTQLARKYPNVPKGAKVKILQENYINFYGGPWSRIEWNGNWYWVSPKDLEIVGSELEDA